MGLGRSLTGFAAAVIIVFSGLVTAPVAASAAPAAGTASVSGKVTSSIDPTKVVPGATVVLTGPTVYVTTTTDAGGRYAFTGLAAETLRFAVDSPDYYDGHLADGAPGFTTVAGSAQVRDAVMVPYAYVEGHVRSGDAGNPDFAGARVGLRGPAQSEAAIADANGNYRFKTRAGATKVSFWDPKFVFITEWWKNAASEADATILNLSPGQTVTGINAQLERYASVSGTITMGTANEPVAYAQPTVKRKNADGTYTKLWNQFSTDTAGRYTLGLVAGTYKIAYLGPDTTLTQWWKGASSEATATEVTLLPGQNLTGFDVNLTKKGSITGTVSVPTTPVQGSNKSRVVLTNLAGTAVSTTTTNEFGFYSFGNVSPGQFKVQFQTDLPPAGAQSAYIPTWYGGTLSVGSAKTVTVGPEQAVTAISGTLQKRMTFTATPVPVISGTVAVGATLTVKNGIWSPAPDSIVDLWYLDGKYISTGKTFYLAPGYAGKKVTVTATATKGFYTTTSKTSVATSPVLKTFSTRSAPVLTGKAVVGQKITSTVPAWVPTSAATTYTYQWYRDGVAIPGATTSSRTVNVNDLGKKLTLTATARLTGYYPSTATSKPTAAVTR